MLWVLHAHSLSGYFCWNCVWKASTLGSIFCIRSASYHHFFERGPETAGVMKRQFVKYIVNFKYLDTESSEYSNREYWTLRQSARLWTKQPESKSVYWILGLSQCNELSNRQSWWQYPLLAPSVHWPQMVWGWHSTEWTDVDMPTYCIL